MTYATAPEDISEILCLLMPNQGFKLILPNTAVVEVVSWINPQPQHTSNSDWLLGFFEWREQRLPLISVHIDGHAPTQSRSFSKIAVLNVTTEELGFQYYGLALCGIPKLVRVNREETSISHAEPDSSIVPPPLSLVADARYITFSGENAWLPDLDQIEQKVNQLFV